MKLIAGSIQFEKDLKLEKLTQSNLFVSKPKNLLEFNISREQVKVLCLLNST